MVVWRGMMEPDADISKVKLDLLKHRTTKSVAETEYNNLN